jgi:hypothetical protein
MSNGSLPDSLIVLDLFMHSPNIGWEYKAAILNLQCLGIEERYPDINQTPCIKQKYGKQKEVLSNVQHIFRR